jgi:hypothetical protein
LILGHSKCSVSRSASASEKCNTRGGRSHQRKPVAINVLHGAKSGVASETSEPLAAGVAASRRLATLPLSPAVPSTGTSQLMWGVGSEVTRPPKQSRPQHIIAIQIFWKLDWQYIPATLFLPCCHEVFLRRKISDKENFASVHEPEGATNHQPFKPVGPINRLFVPEVAWRHANVAGADPLPLANELGCTPVTAQKIGQRSLDRARSGRKPMCSTPCQVVDSSGPTLVRTIGAGGFCPPLESNGWQ